VRYAAFFVALLGLMGTAVAQAPVSEPQSIEITVYNQGIGLVKDRRKITLARGRQTLRFEDVAAKINPTTVHFKCLDNPEAVQILEQNYQFDLVSREKLLEKYLGREIEIVRYDRDGKIVEVQQAVLLGQRGGRPSVVRVGQEIVLDPQGTVKLPALPEGLIIKPTLVWDISSQIVGKPLCEVSYITEGLTWEADYVAVVNQDDTQLDLSGWVTLTNTSGVSYKNAKLKLIAGAVHRVQPIVYRADKARRAGMAVPEAEGFEERAFFEYHLYTLQRPTTIRDNETKQVSLLSADGVKAKKIYILEGPATRTTEKENIAVKIEFKNSKDQGLGLALPQGTVRVYKADQEQSLQFVGEDRIEHTPRDEVVRLLLGSAFDLKADHKVLKVQRIAPNITQYDVEISLRNHKDDQAVEIVVNEKLWGDWQVLNASQEYRQKDARTLEFVVSVPANGQAKVSYRVQVKR